MRAVLVFFANYIEATNGNEALLPIIGIWALSILDTGEVMSGSRKCSSASVQLECGAITSTGASFFDAL